VIGYASIPAERPSVKRESLRRSISLPARVVADQGRRAGLFSAESPITRRGYKDRCYWEIQKSIEKRFTNLLEEVCNPNNIQSVFYFDSCHWTELGPCCYENNTMHKVDLIVKNSNFDLPSLNEHKQFPEDLVVYHMIIFASGLPHIYIWNFLGDAAGCRWFENGSGTSYSGESWKLALTRRQLRILPNIS